MTSLPLLALALPVALAAAACGGEQAAEETNLASVAMPNVMNVVASEYAFAAPAQIPAGLTTIKLANRGTEYHHVQLIKLGEGKTLQDFLALPPDAPLPSWVSFAGGPNAVDPGGETSATSVLEPGRYAMLDWIPGPDGVPHMAKGMATELEVTGTVAADLVEPSADLMITLVDYGYQVTTPISPGTHTVRVDNAGPQVHELTVLRLASGKSVDDLMGWLETMAGPPPAQALGGVTSIDVGQHAYFTATFEPGDYVLLCFVPDSGDGQPHVAHGMVKLITIE
jgi:hypothetical protein